MKNFRKYLGLALCAFAFTLPAAHTVRAAALPPAADDAQSKAPAIVYIIRHAEKPEGEKKNPNLTPQGFKRANALPYLFLPLPNSSNPPRLPKPDFIFAADASKGSNRPIETIVPTAQALHLKVNHDYVDLEYAKLASTLLSGKYAGKVVLICWHHGEIPHLAKALGVEDAPKHWDENVFDQIWQIKWVDGQARMTTIPQELLKGDSTK